MRAPLIPLFLLIASMSGCGGQSSVKPVEALDERTGATLGSLKEPIEFVPSAENAALVSRKRLSFAYLGPVEWDRSGAVSYGMWIHIVPGSGQQPGDIHASDDLTLILDDGPISLSLIETPIAGREPYHRIASWGQTAYFALTVEVLKRMAASRKLELDARAVDGSIIRFTPHSGYARGPDPVHAGSRHHWRLIASTRGNAISVPGRMSPKSTSGLYWATSQTGRSACC